MQWRLAAYKNMLELNTGADVLKYDNEGKPNNLIGDKITDNRLYESLKSRAINDYDFDPTTVRIVA